MPTEQKLVAQQGESPRAPASEAGCGAGAATAAATTSEVAAGGCDGPVPKQVAAAAGANGAGHEAAVCVWG
jgi:hypothetical protein